MTPEPPPNRFGGGPVVLMLCATLLFAVMSVAVKFASARYGAGELVFYRSVIAAVQ